MNSSEKTATLLKLLGRAPYVHSVTELGEQISCSKSCLLYTSSQPLLRMMSLAYLPSYHRSPCRLAQPST